MTVTLNGTFRGFREEVESILNNAERPLGAVEIAEELGNRAFARWVMFALYELRAEGYVEHRNHLGESEWRLI